MGLATGDLGARDSGDETACPDEEHEDQLSYKALVRALNGKKRSRARHGIPHGTGSQQKLKKKRSKGAALGADDYDPSADHTAEGPVSTSSPAAQLDEAAPPVPGAIHDFYADHFDREAAPVTSPAGGPFQPAFIGDAPRKEAHATQSGQPMWYVQGQPLHQAPLQLAHYCVKQRLQNRWSHVVNGLPPDQTSEGTAAFRTVEQARLFAVLNSYRDVYHTSRAYPTSFGPKASDHAMDAVLHHVLNHCAKAADRIKNGNEAIKSGIDAAKKGQPELESPRDQGFTRAKALILAPTRARAHAIVRRLWSLAQAETRSDCIQHKERFLDEFGADDDDDDDDVADDLSIEAGDKKARKSLAAAKKPADHVAVMSGNRDDHFRMGIKITRGAVRLYSDFAQSDIIIASPLGLVTFLSETAGKDGGKDGGKPSGDRDYKKGSNGGGDFMSSIEIAVIERADMILMQNWGHLTTVFQALNEMPAAQHSSTDIMRVRPWSLDGAGRSFRQTVLLSSFSFPEANALMGRACCNWAGRAVVRQQHEGVLGAVIPQLRQVFERVTAMAATAPDARFQHFSDVLWQRMQSTGSSGQLLFVSTYFDFVRVRNFLTAAGADFLHASEYASHSEAARARSRFANGESPLLLYSERAHFYQRPSLRNVQDVLFYQLPHHALFYKEIVNCIGSSATSTHATVTVLFGPEDAAALERIAGSVRSKKMIKAVDTPCFMYC